MIIKKCLGCNKNFYVTKHRKSYCSRKCYCENPPINFGFQKGHGCFGRTKESYIKAGKKTGVKLKVLFKGRRLNTGRTHFKKGVPNNVGKNNPMWKGGYKRKDGYIMILDHQHPRANKHGYILEHRLIMEKTLGRHLESTEAVHHINGIKDDNRPENLSVMTKFLHYGEIECPHCNKKFLVR